MRGAVKWDGLQSSGGVPLRFDLPGMPHGKQRGGGRGEKRDKNSKGETMKPIDQMSQIELARRRKFWTINEMARRCGLSQGTCWHAEVGHDVRPENLRKIRAVLGIKKS